MEDVQGRRQTSEDTGLSDDPRTQIVEEYAQVWEEFYRWEPDMCRQVLLSFSREPQQVVDEPESVGLGQVGDQESEAESDLSFTCWKPDGSTSFINFEEIMAKPFAAHPPYEACTPVSRNIYYRDGDVDDTAQCQFIPYADDPAFNAVTYLTFFPDLAWQTADGLQEPDIDAIQLETLRRLHLGPLGMPLEEIDSHDILPRAVPDLTIGLYAGMLWAATHRDPLPWPGASLSTLGSLATGAWKRECAEDDTLARADSVLTHFCPNLNCIEPHCHTHTFPYPPLIPKKATVNSTGMRLSASQTCGGDCFTHITDYEIFKESVIWEDDDIRTLRDILAITPDSKPCDLAVLCRKPCNEVFAQRCAILPDETIYDFPGRDFQLEQQEETDPIVFDDDMGEEEDKIASIPPCSHEGPCDKRSKCGCFQWSMHCQRGCRCDLDCLRRFTGCSCATTKGQKCGTAVCPCFLLQRECDPELCMPCFSDKGKPTHSCQNNRIQSSVRANTLAKQGSYGLGLFAAGTIQANELIGEYNGDILWQTHAHHRVQIQNYRHLNYWFTLNETVDRSVKHIVDAMRAGNPTMYINHALGMAQNVVSKVIDVNSEHRIGLFAAKKIPVGKELLLDYGPNYFRLDDDDSADNIPEDPGNLSSPPSHK